MNVLQIGTLHAWITDYFLMYIYTNLNKKKRKVRFYVEMMKYLMIYKEEKIIYVNLEKR